MTSMNERINGETHLQLLEVVNASFLPHEDYNIVRVFQI